jgi:hypothetical protein
MYASSLAAVSCLFTGPTELGRTYRLVRFGVDPVPVKLFEIPGGGGQSTGCWYTLTDGDLELTESSARFHYELTYRDSCNNSVLFTNIVEGTYERDGDTLTFVIPAQNTELRYQVEIRDDLLIVREDPSHVYTFSRSA